MSNVNSLNIINYTLTKITKKLSFPKDSTKYVIHSKDSTKYVIHKQVPKTYNSTILF